MANGRDREGAQVNGRAEDRITPIASLWLDYHGTIAHRRAGALKRAVEKALGRKLEETAEDINAMIEKVRLEFDGQDVREEAEGPEKWIAVNMRAFDCGEREARLMSEYVRDEANYFVSKKRLRFVRWLLARFPSHNASGKYVLTASNADFKTVCRFVEASGLDGVQAVSGDLMSVYKPSTEYFMRSIQVTGVPPENTLFIANSWRNDLRAARLGVNVVLILPPSVKLSPTEVISRVSNLKGKVFVVRSLAAAREVIAENFVQIR